MLTSLALLLALGADPVPHVTLGKVTASEALAAVTTELRTHLVPMAGCLDLAAKEAPHLSGTVTVTFVAEPDRGVTSLTTSNDSLKNDTLVPCISARLRSGQWPVKQAPLTVTAVLKFKITP
jgi:hypothetical protein